MKNSYIAYLESTVELQADYIRRLTTLIILDMTYRTSIEGIRLGETWIKTYKASIIEEINKSGGTQIAMEEIRRNIKKL